jgi:GT2 family glycosyltransferase
LQTGQIDHCHGRYAFGWAIPTDRATRCRITAVDTQGEVIAKTTADQPRADLISIGGGACDFGFQLAIPFTDDTGPLRIRADGEDLAGSPLSMGPEVHDGVLTIAGGRVTGWVTNRHTVLVTQDIVLTDQDGQVVMTITPSIGEDAGDPLSRPCRFDAPLPPHVFGRNEICLSARVGESPEPFAQAFGPVRLEGFLDSLSETEASGWLFSPDAPHRRFTVVAFRDGRPVGSAVTRLNRGDVAGRFPEAEACGFDLALKPQPDPRGRLTHLSLRLLGSERDLFGGPFLIGPAATGIKQAQDALADDRLAPGARATLLDAFAAWAAHARGGGDLRLKARRLSRSEPEVRRLAIVIPVYADETATEICINAVLRCRNAATDTVVIVNDNPANGSMAELVDGFAHHPNLFVLRNASNQGFVVAANRGIDFLSSGDVLLLNADTEVFPGAFDEMHRVLHADPRIGSVTALSNNATLFSYPHPTLIRDELADIDWTELAEVALRDNAGQSVPIPTGHGFCMLIRRAVIEEIGLFDKAFGRGYAEENDFSLRAADRGWRHVAAGGVLVRHAEARSFGAEKAALVTRNLDLLAQRFPEYQSRIARFAATDPIRRLRWPLDLHRLRTFAGQRPFWLVVDNWLDGGTARATADIGAVVQPPATPALRLTCQQDGHIILTMDGLALRVVFAAKEGEALFALLNQLPIERVIVHHLLGFTQDTIEPLRRFLGSRDSTFHVHDFYCACPRVTLIDASGAFCGGAAADHCDRCLAMGGAHHAHGLGEIPIAEHRALFHSVLAESDHVVAPSRDAAARLAALLPGIEPVAVPHPQTGTTFPIGVRRGSPTDVCLLGAIGPHKGSYTLLALARHAALTHPDVRFHVIGFTNIDDELEAIGNVSITGRYNPEDLPALVDRAGARIALFLHGWPETFSYTLTEAVSMGLIPVVPDIGAPAERVREAGFGVVVPFPLDVAAMMDTLVRIADGTTSFSRDGGLPLGFDSSASYDRMRAIYGRAAVAPTPRMARARRQRVARG